MPGEGPPDREHLLLAAREQAAAAVAKLCERREVAVGGVCVEPLPPIAEAQVLGHREAEEEAAAFGDVGDAEACASARLTCSGRGPRS